MTANRTESVPTIILVAAVVYEVEIDTIADYVCIRSPSVHSLARHYTPVHD